MLTAACLFAFVVGAQTSASAPAAPDANAAWRELFAQPVPAEANRQLSAVLAACGNDVVRIKAFIAADTAYEAVTPGWHKGRTEVRDSNNARYDVTYLVRVPWGYDANRSWPLLLACHGQGGRGGDIGWMMQEMLAGEANRYVILTPTMPGPANYNGKPYQEQAYLKPLEWARLHLNIDDDRVYVSGYSQGGHQSWHLATMFPQLFAAAVPLAGVPAFEGAPYTCQMYHENLANLPLWAIWGEKDTAPPPNLGNVDVCRAAAARLKALGIATFRGTEIPGAEQATPSRRRRSSASFSPARKGKPPRTRLRTSSTWPTTAGRTGWRPCDWTGRRFAWTGPSSSPCHPAPSPPHSRAWRRG